MYNVASQGAVLDILHGLIHQVGHKSRLTVEKNNDAPMVGGDAYPASVNNRLRSEAPGKRRKFGCYHSFVVCFSPLHEFAQKFF